jgi:hypothetical protein
MLELITKTRDAWAFPYAYLMSLHHDITGSIELNFTTVKVIIEGRNLAKLYKAILEQLVSTIYEADPDKQPTVGDSTLIRSITITQIQ